MSERVNLRTKVLRIAAHALALTASVLACAGTAPAELAAGSGPYTVSRACARDAASTTACDLVIAYFQAINRSRYRTACAMLGKQLRFETGGPGCPHILASGGRQRFAIVGARRIATRVAPIVALDLPEFDHVRVLHWLAVVGLEGGRLKILETRRVV